MPERYTCKAPGRRDAVLHTLDGGGNPILNGIDFLEVQPDHRTLDVHFVHNLTAPFTIANFVIEGGERIRNIKIVSVAPPAANVVVIVPETSGDFSIYTLRLRRSATDQKVPDHFDPQLAAVDFSFKVDCPSDFDCKTVDECPPVALPEPAIDYQAKDFASFRRLMLDRLAVIMPQWTERNPADIGVALVELLAYTGDRLSYYQDATATEAYLGTARKRISVRRHSRLLDYFMHEGANARAWISLHFEGTGTANSRTLPAGTPVLSSGLDPNQVRLDPADTTLMNRVLAENPVWFQTMTDLVLSSAHNSIGIYTWDDSRCCLPAGAVHCTLDASHALAIGTGTVLLFEEQFSPTTGTTFDADPTRRAVVRVTRADAGTDPLHGTPVLEVYWDPMDALPFPFCISAEVLDPQGKVKVVTDVSIVRANVVLADHGRTIPAEPVQPPAVPGHGVYRPVLSQGPLTYAAPLDTSLPAASAANDPRAAVPAIQLSGESLPWKARYDLLASDRFQAEFVVEMDGEGIAHLRFGDGILGRKPSPAATFEASYRVGNGKAGMVGAGTLTRIVWSAAGIAGLKLILENPLPAFSGVDPEPLEQVRQFAPQAFRTQRRAVTAADYAAAAEQNPQVQKAAATFRWTGSWYTVFVTIDRLGGLAVDDAFRGQIRDWLERFRLAGFDLEINAPSFVSLDIGMAVCVKSGYFKSDIKQELERLFSANTLPGGGRGFFHPDNFTFGQPVYLSQIYALAQSVPGVDSVQVTRFQRWGVTPNQELANGVLKPASLEILRLSGDPSFPENGRIEFEMRGGI